MFCLFDSHIIDYYLLLSCLASLFLCVPTITRVTSIDIFRTSKFSHIVDSLGFTIIWHRTQIMELFLKNEMSVELVKPDSIWDALSSRVWDSVINTC